MNSNKLELKTLIDGFRLSCLASRKYRNLSRKLTYHSTVFSLLHSARQLSTDLEEISKDLGLKEAEFNKKLSKIRKQLFNYRENREHPYKDDKILTSWNGLMTSRLSE